MNLKELENLSLSANVSLGDPVNVSRSELSVNLRAVESAKGADDTTVLTETNSPSKDGEDDLHFLTEMMTTQFHHPHHRGAFHQVCALTLLQTEISN